MSTYPVVYQQSPPVERNRLTVFFRIFMVIPHLIVLLFVGLAWAIVAFIAWLSIIFTASFPEGLYNFSVGYLRWSMRVEAYFYLLTDEYPPFSLE